MGSDRRMLSSYACVPAVYACHWGACAMSSAFEHASRRPHEEEQQRGDFVTRDMRGPV